MYNGRKIDDLITSHKVRKSTLCEALGFNSGSQLRQVIHGNPTAKTLEKIADYFNVSVDFFFDRNIPCVHGESDIPALEEHTPGQNLLLSEKLKSAQDIIVEKDRHISSLEKMVSILSEELKSRHTKDGLDAIGR